jgi:hypothetical protein
MKWVVNDEDGMFDEKCVLQLDSLIGVAKEDVEKYNQCHGAGGKFCSGSTGGGGSGDQGSDDDPGFPAAKPEEPAPQGLYSVTTDEAKALASYVGPDYAFINAYSRNPNSGPDKEHYEKMAVKIDSLITKQPPLKGEEIVYRGMNPPKDLAKQLVKGAIIEDKGFMSTTIDQNVAKNFGSTTMTIRVPKGAQMVKVQDYIKGTTADNERESILPRGTKLKITNVHQTAGGLFGMGKKISIEARVIIDE